MNITVEQLVHTLGPIVHTTSQKTKKPNPDNSGIWQYTLNFRQDLVSREAWIKVALNIMNGNSPANALGTPTNEMKIAFAAWGK